MSTGPAHRSVSNIRPSQSGISPTPASPHTPVRTISSTYGSPATVRAEEDCIIIEIGARFLCAGFAGDALPKAVLDFGPESKRRAGDYRRWEAGYDKSWRSRTQGTDLGDAYELWKLDLREVDLGLVGDKIERAIREAYTQYLLVDSRPRKMTLALPSLLPLPLLSTILDSIFTNFQPPTISLYPTPVLSTLSAGLRSALVVDIGWAETIVTSIYELREIRSWRTTRASKLLCQEVCTLLGQSVDTTPAQAGREGLVKSGEHSISFEDCQEVLTRMVWCKPRPKRSQTAISSNLPTLQEEQEEEFSEALESLEVDTKGDAHVSLPLKSLDPSRTVKIPFSDLAEPCETAFFSTEYPPSQFDDHELPLHQLIYHALLHLPVDVRSICMSRIIFVGGGSNIPGLKSRVLDEVNAIIEQYGWEPARGKAIDATEKKQRGNTGYRPIGPIAVSQNALADPDPDPIEHQLKAEASKSTPPVTHGTIRAVESLGAWAGASLMSQLKIPSVSVIDREMWLQQGLAGASKPGEVTVVPNQRQSMGPGTFKAGAGERSSWTLGLWG